MEPELDELSCARWAVALVEQALPRGCDDRFVVLACDDEAVRAAGATLGVAPQRAVDVLVAAVRSAGGLSGAAQRAREFVARPLPRSAPEHLAALALLVLAASRMGDEEGGSTQAYYTRLAALVGPPDGDGHPPYDGFATLCDDGFAALADWLARDEHGGRGVLSLPPDPWPRWVGLPVSQTALRAADRRWLGAFFAQRARQLDAGWDPAGALLHHSARHRLTKPARALLADPRQRPLLSAALRAARAAWDGSVIDAVGQRVLSSRLLAELDPLAGGLTLSLDAPALDADAEAVGPDGVALTVPAPPATLPVPLAWLEHAVDGPARVQLANGRALHAIPRDLVLFEVGSLGLQQVFASAGESLWALTCRPEIDGEPVACALPFGWRLLADVDPEVLPEDARGPDLRDGEPAQREQALRLVGGLPLGGGAWLADAPPAIAGPEELDHELLVDDAPAGRLRDGAATRPAALTGQEGLCRLEAGGLRMDVLLASRGTREGHGTLRWRLDHPARAAAGPGELPPDEAMPTIAGALILGDPGLPSGSSGGPWCRLKGTVWALLADGSRELVRSPEVERWQRAVGYATHGARWQLPAGTVWACQPQRRLVQLVDPTSGVDPTGPDVRALVGSCAAARVSGLGADAAWRRLVMRVEREEARVA